MLSLGNAASFALCAVLLLLLPCYPVLVVPDSSLLPIWISEQTEAPRWTVAALFAANAAFCVLMHTRIGSRIETRTTPAGRFAPRAALLSDDGAGGVYPGLGGSGTGLGSDFRP
ncbi:hypothetical protein [Streptomyces sp. NPDC057302]|uniref:hypothetical protein n=1 Tax=Streptomyces sp. NPDC057302 TaxID=3346094 RepID=UPI0036351190